ncbi:MAG TPA: threonine/serine exporter family protein [Bradyrhizobium sp.]|nr:threonine/serine exporter family protein [Bradyrhizobium sp.]
MTSEQRSSLVLAFARVLYVNGQATEQTVAAAEQLGRILGLRAKVMPRWGELQLRSDDENGRVISEVAADPTGVDMDHVASAARAIEQLGAGRLAPDAAAEAIAATSRAPHASTWLFALAAGAGAVGLSVIFGVEHPVPAMLIFVSAAAGAILRRGVARVSENVFLQPFCAALVAGVIGALAVRYQLSSSLRLVAVCPCMVLVPGPHVLNGALDLINGRIHLGAARLVYAGLVVVAISTGLLLGLALLGVSLPVDEAGRTVPLWQDVIAAGVAVAAYSVFFSTPLNMLPWPVAVGMLSHALRWVAITVLGFGAAIGTLLACLVVGLILTPVARRRHMPFAAIGFASVVSMLPGVLLFRMTSGLVQIAGGAQPSLELISATIADGVSALISILAMSLGLITPKLVIDALSERATQRKS